MMMNLKVALLPLTAICLFSSVLNIAGAQLSYTISAPGVETTNVAGAITETFDGFAPGAYNSINTAVGMLSVTDTNGFNASSSDTNGFGIVSADQYGGENGTGNFLVTGGQNGNVYSHEATLTVSSPASYVGFWWSAEDAANSVQIYDASNTLLGSISGSQLNSLVGAQLHPSAYYGNPSGAFAGQDGGEPYAYVNIFTTTSDNISSIVFSENNDAGFELDNVSVAPAPEASSISGLAVMLAIGGLALYTVRKRSVNA